METTFENGHPYTAIAGELVADVIALVTMVSARRPELSGVGGSVVLTYHAETGEIIVGRLLSDQRVVVVERILADPSDPATFGSSELPIALDDHAIQH